MAHDPSSPSAPEADLPRRPARAENLEFDFSRPAKPAARAPTDPAAASQGASEAAPPRETRASHRIVISDDEDESPVKESPVKETPAKEKPVSPASEARPSKTIFHSEPASPSSRATPREEPPKKTLKTDSHDRTKEPNMSTSSFNDYRQNVQRQSREQKLFGTVVGALVYALVGAILLVAGLAAYGGYVLSRQIKEQSATISELESRFNTQLVALSESLKQTRETVDALETASQIQKTQIAGLTAQLLESRAQSKKERDALQSRLQRIEGRIFELERKTSSSIWSR